MYNIGIILYMNKYNNLSQIKFDKFRSNLNSTISFESVPKA
jgi:hypothetical protein